jgi:hypothetical protein
MTVFGTLESAKGLKWIFLGKMYWAERWGLQTRSRAGGDGDPSKKWSLLDSNAPEIPGKNAAYQKSGAESGAVGGGPTVMPPSCDVDLQRVIDAWPSLSKPLRLKIARMATASRRPASRRP